MTAEMEEIREIEEIGDVVTTASSARVDRPSERSLTRHDNQKQTCHSTWLVCLFDCLVVSPISHVSRCEQEPHYHVGGHGLSFSLALAVAPCSFLPSFLALL